MKCSFCGILPTFSHCTPFSPPTHLSLLLSDFFSDSYDPGLVDVYDNQCHV